MNPYAGHIGERSPLDVISNTPGGLAELMETIGPARLETPPAPGKWSARDILCHLADSELVFAFRLRQTLAEDHHVIQPFDQDLWANAYPACDAKSALAVLSAVRAWNLALIRSVKPENLAKPVTHPERGTMTFQTIVETMAGHDRNHIKQIEAIASQSAAVGSS
jgi:DinB superfamily